MEDEGYTSPSDDPNLFDGRQLNELYDEGIPWDEIAKLPIIHNRHLTWDCLKPPFPYRGVDFLPNPIAERLSLHFCSNDTHTSAELVDEVWKIPEYSVKDSHHTYITADGQRISRTFAQELKCQGLKPIYISLKQFIQHSLHLLAGRESLSFSRVQETSSGHSCEQFRKNRNILVKGISPIGLLNISDQVILCGSLYRRLWKVVESSREETFNVGDNSYVFNSFLKFVQNYLMIQQTIIMLKSSSILTLTELLAFIKPFVQQLDVLSQVLTTKSDGHFADLLAELNQLMFTQETPFIADLIRNLFLTCSFSYLRYTSNWIFRGELGPSSEFHIGREITDSFDDRRSWTKQFKHKERIPLFLENCMDLSLETGRALNLLTTIPSQFLKTSFFCSDSDEVLQPVLSFDGLSKLRAECAFNLSRFFEENSHLQSAMYDTIEEVILFSSSTKSLPLDMKTIENGNPDLQPRYCTPARMTIGDKQQQQQKLRRGLDEQIYHAKEIKALEKIQDDFEQEKIDTFVQKKYDQGLEERRKLAEKYNYRNTTRTYDQGSNSTRSGVIQMLPESASLCCMIDKAEEDVMAEAEGCCNGDIVITEQLLDEHMDESNSVSNNATSVPMVKVNGLDTHTTDKLAGPDHDQLEERFNPDKVLTRDPPPYDLTLPSKFDGLARNFEAESKATRFASSDKDKRNLTLDPHCMNYFISQSIAVPLETQSIMVNTVLLHYIIVEKQLYHHLSAINNYVCLQNGLFGRFLNDLLIEEVNRAPLLGRDDLKHRSGRFNNILNEAIKIASETDEPNPFVKNLTFSLAKDHQKILEDLEAPGNRKASSKFQLLNLLRLDYTVEWPLNIIITEEMLIQYEKIFGFLMQITRAERLLEQVFYLLKCKRGRSAQLHKLQNIRYQFLHFVLSIRNYVNVTVIHAAWTELCSNLHNLNSLEKIYDYLVSHVKNIATSCLLGPKGERLMNLLSSKMRIIESFCSRVEIVFEEYKIDWSRGDEIPHDVFTELCHKFEAAEQIGTFFTQGAFKVARKGIYPKVAFFLQLYNFNEFYQTSEP